jgi:hypothetical protein
LQIYKKIKIKTIDKNAVESKNGRLKTSCPDGKAIQLGKATDLIRLKILFNCWIPNFDWIR